jgi:putative cell wall-binding protein
VAVSDAVETALESLGWGPTVTRLAGANRYVTSVEISKHGFPDGADTVVIATGTVFADALAGAPAAVEWDAPVLLTDPNALPAVIAAEITRLDPNRIVVLGGTAAVTSTVFDALAAIAPTERISGPDRYATAIAISAAAFGSARRAYVATGLNFPDALAGAAAAAAYMAPILLVPGTTLPGTVQSELERLGSPDIVVLGGTVAVATAVQDALEAMLGI